MKTSKRQDSRLMQIRLNTWLPTKTVNTLETADRFKYLGVIWTSDNRILDKINTKIETEYAYSYSAHKVLSSKLNSRTISSNL